MRNIGRMIVAVTGSKFIGDVALKNVTNPPRDVSLFLSTEDLRKTSKASDCSTPTLLHRNHHHIYPPASKPVQSSTVKIPQKWQEDFEQLERNHVYPVDPKAEDEYIAEKINFTPDTVRTPKGMYYLAKSFAADFPYSAIGLLERATEINLRNAHRYLINASVKIRLPKDDVLLLGYKVERLFFEEFKADTVLVNCEDENGKPNGPVLLHVINPNDYVYKIMTQSEFDRELNKNNGIYKVTAGSTAKFYQVQNNISLELYPGGLGLPEIDKIPNEQILSYKEAELLFRNIQGRKVALESLGFDTSKLNRPLKETDLAAIKTFLDNPQNKDEIGKCLYRSFNLELVKGLLKNYKYQYFNENKLDALLQSEFKEYKTIGDLLDSMDRPPPRYTKVANQAEKLRKEIEEEIKAK